MERSNHACLLSSKREKTKYGKRKRSKGKAKQGMENKEKRERESNTVILCWRLNKKARHVCV